MNNQKGVTLIELIMVIVLISIIALASTKMMVNGLTAYQTGKDVMDADWQGRLAMERMMRDLRAIRSPSDITTANSGQIIFTDINGNSVNYSLSGTSLLRNSQTLANGVQSLTFSYLDKNGSTTATLSLIRYITYTLNITQNNSNFNLTTSVYARDLP
jgi:prepilin-type N-terminal cleavage/methylation domain-containing protein